MSTIKELKQDGIDKGLCRLWQRKLKEGLSIKDLCNLYIKGIDFCISNEYPTNDYLRTHFKGKCEPFGIFIDDDIKLRDPKDVVLNGKCTADLEYSGFSVARVYVRHLSDAKISAIGRSFILVDAFDNTRIDLKTQGNAKVIVNLYGEAHVTSHSGNVTIKNRNKKTY